MKTFASRPPVLAPKPVDKITQQAHLRQDSDKPVSGAKAYQPATARSGHFIADMAIRPRDAGRTLADPLRRKMQAAFGHDFSDVRIRESQAAPQMDAVAFTQGSDVYLAPNAVDPETSLGEAILGHELAHVVQQRSGRVTPSPTGGALVHHNRLLEDEANVAGIQATLDRPAPMHQPGTGAQPAASPAIQMVDEEDVKNLAARLREENEKLGEDEAGTRAKNALEVEEAQAKARREALANRGKVVHSEEMKANIGRKAAEQRELQKWNPNAQGRSQGLVHILDYAYARPPMRPEEHPQAEEISRGQPMSGRKFMERLGIKDEKAFAKFAATNLEEYRSENEDLGKPLLPVAEKNGDGKIKFTNPQEQQQELQGLEAQMRDMMKDLEPVEKKQVGQSEAYRDLAQRKKALEASLLLSKGYRVKRDESKRGRIAQVEKAIGKAPGEFKSGEGEITGVTRALDLLTGETKPASVQGPTGQPMTLAKEWVRSKKADQPPRWTEKENVEITDTAQGEEYQTAGTADRPNLEIRKWGPHPKAVRYSTVHGASGKK